MDARVGILLLIVSAALLGGGFLSARRQRVRVRLFRRAEVDGGNTRRSPGRLARWLLLAGYRDRRAPAAFVAAQAAATALAAVSVLLWSRADLGERLVAGVEPVPGPAGALMALVIAGGPLIVFATLVAAPWIVVRAARRARVEGIEQDLPVNLELLATLSEAGLGFDAAVERLLASQPGGRPLVTALRLYQRDTRAGLSRVESLGRLAERVEVPAARVLTSALIQAEQVGSSVSGILRTQAEDLRNLRRERALARAEILETKLVFPLVICFLPGLFVAATGPAFYQFVQLIDRILRSGV